MHIADCIHSLTVPCSDNGHSFTRTDRISVLERLIADTNYLPFGKSPLALIYQHPEFSENLPLIMVSTHIDSLYDQYHSSMSDGEFLGTYDNSITNAAILHLMQQQSLSPQVMIAFTGDEEHQSRGADQVVALLKNHATSPLTPSIVVVLDVTEEAYGDDFYSIENLFIGSSPTNTTPSFPDVSSFLNTIKKALANQNPHCVINGAPDESWQYDEHDLHCFAYCLPCRTITGDMHDDDGVYVKESAVIEYTTTLEHLLNHLTLTQPNNQPQ